jgi:L-fuconate dehydratase
MGLNQAPRFQEELVNSAAFRYISDAITKEEALAMLKEKEAGKKEREEKVRELGQVVFNSFKDEGLTFSRYPAYVTSAGWLGMLLFRSISLILY